MHSVLLYENFFDVLIEQHKEKYHNDESHEGNVFFRSKWFKTFNTIDTSIIIHYDKV